MCKKNKGCGRRVDPCLKNLIGNLKYVMQVSHKIVACCCGHGKYPMTLVAENEGYIHELVSGVRIPRKKKFYKKDKEGYYFIPEVIDNEPCT